MREVINNLEIPDEVKADISAVVDALVEKFPANIKKVILFGSYAKDLYQPDSDVDLAVVLRELPPMKERRAYLQVVDLERDVDLLFCTLDQLNSKAMVYKQINEQGVLLYEQL